MSVAVLERPRIANKIADSISLLESIEEIEFQKRLDLSEQQYEEGKVIPLNEAIKNIKERIN